MLIISPELKNILKNIDHPISKKLLSIKSSPDINYLDISKKDKTKISYITNERFDKILTKYPYDLNIMWKKGRYLSNVSKVLSKILIDFDYQNNLNDFILKYKYELEKSELEFKVINGKKLRKYYYSNNYQYEQGTLGNSCMRHYSDQKYIKLYSKNKNIKMLILKYKNSNKILARSLLWETDNGYKIMDKVYYSLDKYVSGFNKWAKKNGYLIRENNNWNSCTRFIDKNGNKKELFLSVKLNRLNNSYPYVDTFKWIDLNDKILYNYNPKTGNDVKLMMSVNGKHNSRYQLIYDPYHHVFKTAFRI
jgi:hypothetical protein